LLAVTIQDIRPNPQDTSAYYLANIFQQLNGTVVPTLPNPAASFTPPTSALWVNGLWFMSLVISLTCAVLSTLLQQWSRRYLRVAYPRCSPHKRARIRTFYAKGVEKSHLPTVVETLPALLHVSLFLFFAGLAVFLFGVNRTMSGFVIAWVGLCVVVYAYLTILPIRHKDSPYSAPLSMSVFFCLTGIRPALFRLVENSSGFVRSIIMRLRNRDSGPHYHSDDFTLPTMLKTAEEFALNKLDRKIVYDSLSSMFESLDEDKALEEFFDGIPGFCASVTNAKADFIKPNKEKLSNVLMALMDRTLSSNLVSESVKLRRILICTKAIDVSSFFGHWWILCRVLIGNWQQFLGCIEFGLSVQNWRNNTDPATAFCTQCVAAATISLVSKRERDDRWFQLASGPLGASKRLYQNYLEHIDSILLADATFIVRRTIEAYSRSADSRRKAVLRASAKTLESFCKLDLGRTSPELQHEFCSAWNQLVDLARNGERLHAAPLKSIRKLYIELHKDTGAFPTAFSSETDDKDPVLDDPNSYCKCQLAEHLTSGPVQIEGPALEAATNTPPMPPVQLGTIAPSHPDALLTPMSMSTPSSSPVPPATAQGAATFPQATHHSGSRVEQQAAPVPATHPIVGPTSSVPLVVSTLPVPQVTVPPARCTSGAPYEGALSASSLSLAPPSSLGHTSSSAD